jgi:hypothetical protein
VLLGRASVEVVDEPAELGALAARELRRLVDQRLPRLPAVDSGGSALQPSPESVARTVSSRSSPASPDRAVPRSSITACFTSGLSKKRAAPRTT